MNKLPQICDRKVLPMLKLVNVSKYYNSNNVVALGLRKINLELGINEFVAVVGESGSGKTTLLNVISGMDSYEDGEMYINGQETSYFSINDLENYRKKYIAFVFQNFNLIDSYTVLQNVELPLLLSGKTRKEARAMAMEIIKKVGLEKHARHKATRLSGGQKQRAVIARALAKDCPIIAADEPTGNLDSESAAQIMKLLHEIAKDKLVIVVTHDFEQVKEYATRKIRIYDGEIVEDVQVHHSKPADLPEIEENLKRLKPWEQVKMAFVNLMAVPKKTILMVFVFFFLSSFVALVYGAYRISVSYVDQYYYYTSDDEFFSNTSISRVILNKKDYSPFTASELADLSDIPNVQTVIYNDYLIDVSIYMISNEQVANNGRSRNMLADVLILPMSVIKDANVLSYGELPDEEGEVLLALPAAELEKSDLYLNNAYTMNGFSNIYLYDTAEYLITGLVDAGDLFMDETNDYIIVSDAEFARLVKVCYLAFTKTLSLDVLDSEGDDLGLGEWFSSMFMYNGLQILVDDSLTDSEIGFDTALSDYLCYDPYGTGDHCGIEFADLTVEDAYHDLSLSDLEVTFIDNQWIAIYLSQNNYDRIFYSDIYQVSLLTKSDINVGRLVSDLVKIKDGTEAKYNVVYPYEFETDDQFGSAMSFFQLLGMLMTVLATALASTLLSYIIFRAVINTKLKDYTIFRTVGATQGVIRLMIYLEDLFVALFSFLLFVVMTVSFKLSDAITRYSAFYGLKAFRFQDYVLFFVILILMSIFISGRYCNRIFKDTVTTTMKRG